MANEAPPLSLDQKETKESNLTEKNLAKTMLEQSSDRQDELVSWINGVRKGHGMNDAFYQAYDRFRKDNVAASEEDWVQSLEQELLDLESKDNLLISVLGDLDSPMNANKSLEEILNACADKEQDTINARVQSGAWASKMTDEQRGSILGRRDAYHSLAEQAGFLRNSLESDVHDSKKTKTPPAKQPEAPTEPTKADTDQGKTEKQSEQDSAIANSEAEVQAIIGALESVRPDIQRLSAMSKGSLSTEQAAGYLLIANQRMMDSTGLYAKMLKNIQEIGQIEHTVAIYDKQIGIDYSDSMNAINAIRQKTQTLPIALKAPMLTYCQNIENTLGRIITTIRKKDGKIHNTPSEKLATDNQELEDESRSIDQN